jgi:hypothetical protein
LISLATIASSSTINIAGFSIMHPLCNRSSDCPL